MTIEAFHGSLVNGSDQDGELLRAMVRLREEVAAVQAHQKLAKWVPWDNN